MEEKEVMACQPLLWSWQARILAQKTRSVSQPRESWIEIQGSSRKTAGGNGTIPEIAIASIATAVTVQAAWADCHTPIAGCGM